MPKIPMEWLVDDDLRNGRLIRLLDDYAVNKSSESPAIYAVFPKARSRPKKVEAFVQFFAGKMKGCHN